MKRKSLLALLSIPVVFTLLVVGCQKGITNEGNNGEFNVPNAKEWWYGSFRKTPAYNAVDYSSQFASPASLGVQATKKYPSWKEAVSYKIGNLEIVEAPLYYNNWVVLFPGSRSLSENDKKRVAEASLRKMLLIKKEDNTVEVRTVTLIPSAGYAQQRSYDISNNTLQKPDLQFSGWMVIKNWKETVIGFWQVEKGRRVRRMAIREKQVNKSLNLKTNKEVCRDEWVEKEYKICIGDLIVGDQPDAVPECTEWSTQIIGDFEWVCTEEEDEIPDPEDEDDSYESCMAMGGTSQQCLCSIYGLECGDGDGGGGGDDGNCDIDGPNALNNLVNSSTVSDEIESITTLEELAETRTKKYEWTILKNIGWRLYSWEKGVHIKKPNVSPSLQWEWQSLEHQGIARVGIVAGGSVEHDLISANPTIGKYNAIMDLDYKVTYSIVCKGSPFTIASVYGSNKNFHVSD